MKKTSIYLTAFIFLLTTIPGLSNNKINKHQFDFNLGIERWIGEFGLGSTIGIDYSYCINSMLGLSIGYSQTNNEYKSNDNQGLFSIDNYKYYDAGVLFVPFFKKNDHLKLFMGLTIRDQTSLFTTSYYIMDTTAPSGTLEYGKLIYPQLIDRIAIGIYAALKFQVYEKDSFSLGLKGIIRGPYENEFESYAASAYIEFKF